MKLMLNKLIIITGLLIVFGVLAFVIFYPHYLSIGGQIRIAGVGTGFGFFVAGIGVVRVKRLLGDYDG